VTVDFDVSHPWHGRTGDERKMIAWIEDEAFGLSLSSWPREDPVLVVVKYGLSNGSLLVRWCSEYRSAGGHFADLLERDRGAGVPFQQVGYGFSRISPKGGIVPPLIRPSDWHFRPNLRTILSTVLAATLWPDSPNRHMCICRCQHPFGLLKKVVPGVLRKLFLLVMGTMFSSLPVWCRGVGTCPGSGGLTSPWR
jgi:hypothetical protein